MRNVVYTRHGTINTIVACGGREGERGGRENELTEEFSTHDKAHSLDFHNQRLLEYIQVCTERETQKLRLRDIHV